MSFHWLYFYIIIFVSIIPIGLLQHAANIDSAESAAMSSDEKEEDDDDDVVVVDALGRPTDVTVSVGATAVTQVDGSDDDGSDYEDQKSECKRIMIMLYCICMWVCVVY